MKSASDLAKGSRKMITKEQDYCVNVLQDGQKCDRIFYKYKVKPEDKKGFCRKCNRKFKQKPSKISFDENKNYNFICSGACKRSYTLQRNKIYCKAGYCRKCYADAS